MASKYFQKIDNNNPKYLEIFANKSLDLIEHIYDILKSKGLNQKDLADMLNKKESEISKWLSGGHNITLMTISKIEEILEESILIVPKNDFGSEKKKDIDSSIKIEFHSKKKTIAPSKPSWKKNKYKR